MRECMSANGRYVRLTKDGFRAEAVIATSLVEDWDLDAQICSQQLTSPSETAISDFSTWRRLF